MVRRSYKFTDKKHTKQGLLSVACGGTALILTAASLSLAYQRSGQAGSIVSLLGVFAMLASVVGFVLALRGFQEEDVYVISSSDRRGCGRTSVYSVGDGMRDRNVGGV
ncbi:MAG: DUF6142 family protein [Anaerosacchariphilus sp.]